MDDPRDAEDAVKALDGMRGWVRAAIPPRHARRTTAQPAQHPPAASLAAHAARSAPCNGSSASAPPRSRCHGWLANTVRFGSPECKAIRVCLPCPLQRVEVSRTRDPPPKGAGGYRSGPPAYDDARRRWVPSKGRGVQRRPVLATARA
jgi:hypothetical protein